MKIEEILEFLQQLQADICQSFSTEEGKDFHCVGEKNRATDGVFNIDKWESQLGYGRTMVLKNGHVFEQAGVNFSHVKADQMPVAATKERPYLVGAPFEAMGVSVVAHPQNPFIPTSHANVRLFVAYPKNQDAVWWFGGGFDLTPYYPFDEDIIHWHTVARDLCYPFDVGLYAELKQACDQYFYLQHRQETRGVGGLFFDDMNQWDFQRCFDFMRAVGQGYLEAYMPLVKKRKDTPFGDRERQFQLYRRGRYVEFNLVWDRGTHFGLQSGGRTESILMSLPPAVRFEYDYQPQAGSAEAKLNDYLQARDWV